ncbi:MAG: elongation factor G, partial [Lachnospiraceae bacterium]|nr:elongation factor G [Lachnospiraceae bacterium]
TKTNEVFDANYDFTKPKSAFIWKTISDPFLGKYSIIKVASGVIKKDDMLYNEDKDTEEKLAKLYMVRGNQFTEVTELHAGDIGAIAKLNQATTGDTLSTKANPIRFPRINISTPYHYMRYKPKNKGDIDKISQALQKITQEDLTIRNVNDAENRQTLLYGIGEQHLDVVVSKLLSEYKVEIELSTPKVAYRETIRKNSDEEYKYKKQSGGHGQYGHVKMRFEPSGDMDKPYIFEQQVVGGVVPKNYFPAVEKGVAEACERGPLAAYPVVGVKATLYDGSYHAVDSSEMAFKTAARECFKKGMLSANPVLLEPVMSLKVTVPDKFTGDIMGDLNKRRARVLGMGASTDPTAAAAGRQTIEAEIPMGSLFGYSTVLRSLTQGSGDFEYEFIRYEQTPAEVQAKEVEARKDKVNAESVD